MTAKREEEEEAILAAGGTVQEKRQRMKAAGRMALLGVNMSQTAKLASAEKASRPETDEERAARCESTHF